MDISIIKHKWQQAKLPDKKEFMSLLKEAVYCLTHEDGDVRPRDKKGRPGGLIELPPLKTVLVPDVHGRRDYIYKTFLKHKEELDSGAVQIVFMGDYVHTERTTVDRWRDAFEEFSSGFISSEAMDGEMTESLITLEMLSLLKTHYPSQIFLLKGNHENIKNESIEGNRGFRKYASEGDMVKEYIIKKYGDEVLEQIYIFEKSLGLMAQGNNFLVSHAEPGHYYSKENIIRYRDNYDIVYDLIWTPNGRADASVVPAYLSNFTIETREYYFAGHRVILDNKYKKYENHFVQIHNPDMYINVVIPKEGDIDLDRDIINLKED